MNQIINSKPYNLEERTLKFAKDIRIFIKKFPKKIENIEDCKQLIRSSGSIGANYIEANESLSKKDFIMRIKISKKEAKESCYWLQLLITDENCHDKQEAENLLKESTELMKILGSILEKCKQ